MKKIILLFIAVFSLNISAQSSLTPKQYKKILKKLELNIVNNGFVNESSIVLLSKHGYTSPSGNWVVYPSYKKLWEDALFEEEINFGTIDEENKTNSRWQLEILSGGYSGQITDIDNNHKMVLKFSTKEGMNVSYDGRESKRSREFKNYVKVIFSEIMKTAK